ncbi:MAG: hypothetical protein A6F72_07530 [Cycloclasticus sp. symbiont of Poecilosclerida sp. N]|nr:MAG: hypothetical protein A6F72_07530 [Cycloclasticus sp. symbiont of Poecilosclerida sp. N]
MSNLPELGQLNRKEMAVLVGVALMNRESASYQGTRKSEGGRIKLLGYTASARTAGQCQRCTRAACAGGVSTSVAGAACAGGVSTRAEVSEGLSSCIILLIAASDKSCCLPLKGNVFSAKKLGRRGSRITWLAELRKESCWLGGIKL